LPHLPLSKNSFLKGSIGRTIKAYVKLRALRAGFELPQRRLLDLDAGVCWNHGVSSFAKAAARQDGVMV